MKTKRHSILWAPMTQSGDQTRNNSTYCKWFAPALGGFLFASISTLSAPRVEAQCQQWNVGHGWRFKQGPTAVQMNLHQNGSVVTGTAAISLPPKKGDKIAPFHVGGGSFGSAENQEVSGDVDGSVKGNRFAVIIHWSNGTTGVYNGTIGPSGRIEGTGFEQRSPSKKVNWYSETHMDCADAAPAKPASSDATKSELNAAADTWLEQERRKHKTATQPTPGPTARGFINGIQLASPTPGPEADEAASDDTQDQHKKNKKNKKRHHHHDDNQEQPNE